MLKESVLPDYDKLKVLFLVGSQELYGEETLRQVHAQSQEICEVLNESGDLPLKVVGRPTLVDSSSIAKAISEANEAEDVVGVIA